MLEYTRTVAAKFYVVFYCVGALLLLEIVGHLMLPIASRIVNEPISRTSTIYAEQSQRIASMFLRMERLETVRDVVDPVLGWRYRSGFSGDGETISMQGVRGSQHYSSAPTPGRLRVAVFGDSFVYGNEARDAETWSFVAEQAAPTIEILNYGVGGYGTDQAYLRFLAEGESLKANLVVLGFVAVDLPRNVSVYRRFADPREAIAVKPRFQLDAAGRLVIISSPIERENDWRRVLNNPRLVKRWGAHDQFYSEVIYGNLLYDWSAFVRLVSFMGVRVERQILSMNRFFNGIDHYNTGSEAFKITVALFKAFAERARANGQTPILLMIPLRPELERSLAGHRTRLDHVISAAKGYADILDATNAFPGKVTIHDVAALFAPGGHYSKLGNQIIGEWLAGELTRRYAGQISR